MRFGRGTYTVLTTLGFASTALADKPAAKNVHNGWAYPQGILVSTDGGKVSPPEKKNKDDDDPPTPATNDELVQLLKGITTKLNQCMAALRLATPELQQNGARYGFNLDFGVGADGRVFSMTQSKHAGSAALPDCAVAVATQTSDHRFRPPKEGQALDAHAEYDLIVLNDEDAQGRGYLYIAGEKAWGKALREHPAWFQCKADADCVVTGELCEVRAVASTAVADYRKAIALRKKPPCYKQLALDRSHAVCRHQQCAVAKGVGPKPGG